MLFVVPTPIGNLGDITLRSLETLKKVDLILCEDTRVTRKLAQHYEISTPLKSFHTHNEHRLVNMLINQLYDQDMALVSDGGTPGISDPGYLLIKACYDHDIQVDVLPGASALTTAIVRSGLPSNRFYFEGFLPHKKGRKSRLEYITSLDQTVVLYESPHRLLRLLNQLSECDKGERQIVIVKEISKKFEKRYAGTVLEMIEIFKLQPKIKGEFVVIIAGE